MQLKLIAGRSAPTASHSPSSFELGRVLRKAEIQAAAPRRFMLS